MSLIYFILIMGFTVAFHEFGHLISAKMFGVYCYEYAIGMGPLLFSKKGKETEYSLRLLPIGGFVRMAGEEVLEEDSDIPKERQLQGIAKWKRVVVMLAGIFNNIILALALFSVLYCSIGYYYEYPEPVINTVIENSAAEKAGLMSEDRIVSITYENGVVIKPKTFDEVSTYTQAFHSLATYEIERNGEIIYVTFAPEYDEEAGRYLMGVTMKDIILKEVKWYNAPYYGTKYAIRMMKDIYTSLVNLLAGRGLENLSGPVGIYTTTSEVMSSATSFKEGLLYFINIWALISLNVGVFNLLPIPLFDGGRVFLLFIEAIVGHPLDPKVESALMTASIVLVFIMFAFVMYNDVSKLIG